MAVTPETLTRHELVGLRAEVAAGANPDVVGIQGTVVTETAQTLGIQGPDRVRYVPKESATFVFDLPAGDGGVGWTGAHGGRSDASRVRVDGSTLVARPAQRTERTGDSKWR